MALDFWLNTQGFVISDWEGLDRITTPPHSNYSYSVQAAIEAGIDCIMVSEKRILKPAKFLYQKAKEDSAFEEKINAAARRILLYKLQNGQMEIVEDLSAASEALPFGYKITSDNFYKKQNNKEERLSDFLKAKEENQELYERFYK